MFARIRQVMSGEAAVVERWAATIVVDGLGLFSMEAYRKAEAGYLAHVRSAEYSHPFLGELRRASEQSNRVLNTKDHLRIGLARILRRVIGRWRLAGSLRLHEAYRRLTYFSASE